MYLRCSRCHESTWIRSLVPGLVEPTVTCQDCGQPHDLTRAPELGETGKQQYAKRTQGSVWATPLATRDRLYLFGTNGTTTIVKSGATFKTLAENQLWSTESQAAGGPGSGATLYAAAAAGSQLILRRGDVLYCVGK